MARRTKKDMMDFARDSFSDLVDIASITGGALASRKYLDPNKLFPEMDTENPLKKYPEWFKVGGALVGTGMLNYFWPAQRIKGSEMFLRNAIRNAIFGVGVDGSVTIFRKHIMKDSVPLGYRMPPTRPIDMTVAGVGLKQGILQKRGYMGQVDAGGVGPPQTAVAGVRYPGQRLSGGVV